jgi:AAHS family 4-hydroxybenzoate transporter-like MFS transporter
MAPPDLEATDPPMIDIAALIERQNPRRMLVRLVLISWLVTFFDGFDLNAIAFAAPYLSAQYAFANSELANIFIAGGAGSLLGGLVFGALGDRIGRRRAIIGSVTAFGVLTLCHALCDRYWELLVVRFLDGVAIGGAIPLTWSLSVEYVPMRVRATAVTLIMLGYGIGVSAAGPVSLQLLPRFGWQSIFVFGGVVSLASAVLLISLLPESLRYLAAVGASPEQLRKSLQWLTSDRAGPGNARLTFSEVPTSEKASWGPGALFEGNLRWVTPLLWLGFASSSMTSFFFTTWGPIMFESLGFTRSTAAWALSMNSLASGIGALALMRLTDRAGVLSLALLPLAAIPFLLAIGLTPVSPAAFIIMMGALQVFLGGSHYGITSIAGNFYPTPHRGLGSGWMSGMGKLGSILAPWLGGLLLGSLVPVRHTFLVLALFPAVLAMCAVVVGMLERTGRLRQAV